MAVSELLKADAQINLLGGNESSSLIDHLRAKQQYIKTRKQLVKEIVDQIANDNSDVDDISELSRLVENDIRSQASMPPVSAEDYTIED